MAAPVRRFGPLNGPGVVIRERKPVGPIVAAPFGRVVMAGRFRRGEVHDPATPKLNHCLNLDTFDLLMGGRDREQEIFDAPIAAEHYFQHAKGAGKVLAIRVTDGAEEKASCLFYARRWGTCFGIPQSATDDETQLRIPVLRMKARNGGRWAGRRAQIRDAFAIAGDLTSTTLTTGLTMTTNQWAGAALTFSALPNRTYEVISNTSAGVVTVKTGSTMKADYDDVHPAGTDKVYRLFMETKSLSTGGFDALAGRPVRGRRSPTTEFGIEIFVDGTFYRRYDDLSMDPTSRNYVETITKDDPLVEFEDLLPTAIPIFADHRPCAFYSTPVTVAATSITFPIGFVTKNDTVVAQVVGIEHNGVDPVPHRLKLVWVLATKKYTVTAEALDDSRGTDSTADQLQFTTMAGDTTGLFDPGGGAVLHKTYLPGTGIPSVKVTIDHTADPADGKTIEIDVPGMPREIAGGNAVGYVLPDAKNDPLVQFAISSTDAKLAKVTIVAGDLTVAGTAPTQATVTGTVAQPYAILLGVSDKMKIAVDGRTSITVTLTAGGAVAATVVRDEINAAFDAIYGAGVLNPASVNTANKVVLTSAWWEGGGPASSIKTEAIAADAYTLLGFTSDALTRGIEGDEVELSFAAECEGGHDGGEPADADLIEAFDLATSPLKRLAPGAEGMLSMCTPGVTSAAVQKQLILFGTNNNFAALVQIPSAKLLDSEADAFTGTDVGRSDLAYTYYPTFGDIRDPDRDGSIVEVPLCGMILGEIAAMAANVSGYHHATAGIQVTLPEVVDVPTDDRVLDEEFLTPRGINVIKKRDANYIIWGARTLSDETLFVQLTQRLQLSHYEHTLSKSLESFIFALNDPIERAVVIGILDAYFQIEWANRVLYGKGKNDSWTVKADAENNPVSEIEAGNMHVDIALKFTPFTERLVVSVGKSGIFDSVSV